MGDTDLELVCIGDGPLREELPGRRVAGRSVRRTPPPREVRAWMLRGRVLVAPPTGTRPSASSSPKQWPPGCPSSFPRDGALAEVAGSAAALPAEGAVETTRDALVRSMLETRRRPGGFPREPRPARFSGALHRAGKPDAALDGYASAMTRPPLSPGPQFARPGAPRRSSVMSGTAARRSLLVAALLIVWGPPALRLAGRGLDAALTDPFALDPAALLQVGAWVFADALVLVLLISHIDRGTGFLSALLPSPAALVRPLRPAGRVLDPTPARRSTPLSSPTRSWSASWCSRLLEWHWPARHGSRAVAGALRRLRPATGDRRPVLHDRQWVTPFGSRTTENVSRDRGRLRRLWELRAPAGLLFLTVCS